MSRPSCGSGSGRVLSWSWSRCLLRAPQAGEVTAPAAPAVQQTRRDYGPAEALQTPVFWVMYAMFVMVLAPAA